MLTFTAHTECVSATEEPPVCNVCDFVFGFELGMGSVDTVCDMSNRHVSRSCPMDVAQPAYTPFQIEWNFMIFLYSCQIQICQLSGNFY